MRRPQHRFRRQRCRGIRPRGFVLMAGLVFPPVARIDAQTFNILVHSAGSAAPVVGAVVSLIHDSVTVREGLTNTQGLTVLQAAEAGTYRVRVKRIGYRPNTSRLLRAGKSENVSVVFELTLVPTTVAAVSVVERDHARADRDRDSRRQTYGMRSTLR